MFGGFQRVELWAHRRNCPPMSSREGGAGGGGSPATTRFSHHMPSIHGPLDHHTAPRLASGRMQKVDGRPQVNEVARNVSVEKRDAAIGKRRPQASLGLSISQSGASGRS